MKVIIIIGLPGSGKSLASNCLFKKKIPVYKPGSIIKDEVVKRGLELTVESEEHIARDLRKEHGKDAPARLLGSTIEKGKSDIICIDGFRNIEEVHYIERFGKVFLVEVRTPKKVRYSRLIGRAHDRDPETHKLAEWRDRKEIERGLNTLLTTEKYTKFVINNNGRIHDFKKRLDEILGKIRNMKE